MKNEYEVRGNVTAIFLRKKDGSTKETLIDTEDLSKVDEFPNTWYQRGDRYVVGMSGRKHARDKGITRNFHRIIMDCPDDKVVDHINRNALDNRKSNLRIVTTSENNQNIPAQKNTISGIRGVTWDKHKDMWKAAARIDGKTKFLGLFTDINEAEKVASEARLIHMPYSQEATQGTEYTGQLEKHRKEIETKGFRHNKTSGIRGISWHTQSESWRVSVMINKKIHSSLHKSIEKAKVALNHLKEIRSTLI